VKPDEIYVFTLPVLGDLQEIDDAVEARFPGELRRDVSKADRLD
jgi:hypothetical protein